MVFADGGLAAVRATRAEGVGVSSSAKADLWPVAYISRQ